MSADFWAGWASGLAGLVIGNPLDILKVQLQAGRAATTTALLLSNPGYSRYTSLIRGEFQLEIYRQLIAIFNTNAGVAAPAFAYGALNALLYVSYNRMLLRLDPTINNPTDVPYTALSNVWAAGAVGGLAIWVVSAPSELVKCQAQLGGEGVSSWSIARDIYRQRGVQGLYRGGVVTSVRDSFGYGF
ncbi:hypothetical protein MMC10_007681 [Thelotrema lepadinum]|nr:hypothetical protein [Thelotrema lepadinum]